MTFPPNAISPSLKLNPAKSLPATTIGLRPFFELPVPLVGVDLTALFDPLRTSVFLSSEAVVVSDLGVPLLLDSDPEPPVVLEPEPVVEPPVVLEPDPEPLVVLEPEPDPEPLVVLEPVLEPPVVLEPEPLVEPEPPAVVEPELEPPVDPVFEPEPPVVVGPLVEPEPDPAVEPPTDG